MKYSFHYIFDVRYTLDQSAERKIANHFVILSAITKFISPLPTWIFLNLGIKPDWVTFASILALIVGAFLFTIGQAVWGVVAILCFALFDSVDGDMARCVGPTSYGATLDSFGADFFYALIPTSLGYYLYSIDVAVGSLGPENIFLIAAFVSVTLLLYRLVRAKHFLFSTGKGTKESIAYQIPTPPHHGSLNSVLKNTLFRLVKFSRSTIVRNNFFAEPGMLLFFSLFSLLGWWKVLALYFIILLFYNSAFLIQNFAHAYISFIKQEGIK